MAWGSLHFSSQLVMRHHETSKPKTGFYQISVAQPFPPTHGFTNRVDTAFRWLTASYNKLQLFTKLYIMPACGTSDGFSILSSHIPELASTSWKYRVVVATLPSAVSSLVEAEQTPSPEATVYGRPGEWHIFAPPGCMEPAPVLILLWLVLTFWQSFAWLEANMSFSRAHGRNMIEPSNATA